MESRHTAKKMTLDWRLSEQRTERRISARVVAKRRTRAQRPSEAGKSASVANEVGLDVVGRRGDQLPPTARRTMAGEKRRRPEALRCAGWRGPRTSLGTVEANDQLLEAHNVDDKHREDPIELALRANSNVSNMGARAVARAGTALEGAVDVRAPSHHCGPRALQWENPERRTERPTSLQGLSQRPQRGGEREHEAPPDICQRRGQPESRSVLA